MKAKKVCTCLADPACNGESLPGLHLCEDHAFEQVQGEIAQTLKAHEMAEKGCTWQKIVKSVPGIAPRKAQIEVLAAKMIRKEGL
jgi:hypothetical protein